jgi:choline dehydrogenase-like flavoprotein
VPYYAPPLQPSHSVRLGYSIVFSAMPAIVTANTNASVYGIAERAAPLTWA